MRRILRLVRILAAFTVGLPLLGLALLLLSANTAPGRALLEQLTPRLSGGTLSISGLSGRFPDAVRIERVAVHDQDGAWLTADRLQLDWSPLRLLRGELAVQTVAAERVIVARTAQTGSHSSGVSGALPLSVAIDDLRIDRLDLDPRLAGASASVSVTGKLHLVSVDRATVALQIATLDGTGRYRLDIALAADTAAGRIDAEERAHGLLSGILGLPGVGPLALSASLDGPRDAARVRLALAAGPFTARGQGEIDLLGKTADVAVTASSPAMRPRADLDWQSVRLDAHLAGSLDRPRATGQLDITGLRAGGGGVEQVKAELSSSDSGSLNLVGLLAGLRLPGAQPDLFAAAPVAVRVTALLNEARRPVRFALSHPLLTASGEVDAAGTPSGSVSVTLPELAPYAAIAGVDIRGQATLRARLAQQGAAMPFELDGTVGITGGLTSVRDLVGQGATIAMSGALRGEDIVFDSFALDGRTLGITAAGSRNNDVVDLGWKLTLSDISALSASLAGELAAEGHITGRPADFALTAQTTGEISVAGLPREPLTVSLSADGLPNAASGTLTAEGRLAGAPLQLTTAMTRAPDGTLDVALDRLQWKSAVGGGDLRLAPGAVVPLGRMHLRLGRLDDLAPLIGLAIAGSADLTLDTEQADGKPQARLHADLRHLALDAAGVDQLTLDAGITDPAGEPRVSLAANAGGIRAAALSGSARLTANGTPDALELRLSSELQSGQAPARLLAAATARVPQRDLQLVALQADYAGATARLLAPARIAVAGGLAVDTLRLGIGKAVVALSGRLTPTLALSLSAQDVSPSLAKPFVPGLDATGTIALNGQLTGSVAAPSGSVHLTGHGLRSMQGLAAGLPATEVDATATLSAGAVRLDARLNAGSSTHLRLAGTAPLRTAAALDLRLTGATDLAMLDPLLTPGGRTARGQVTLDLGVAGTLTTPSATGSVRLAGGSLQDFGQGIHLTELAGLVEAQGDTLRIVQLAGRAGSGTVTITGTIGWLKPEVPIALTVTARDARPLASDLLTATLGGELTVRGEIRRALAVAGEIHVTRATITIPDSLAQGVAVLNVRRPGQKAASPSAPGPPIALALTIVAPQQIFVRGHGIDAEMGGTLKLGGTITAPTISGGFDLRHGTFSLAGQTLTFTSGKVAFGGRGLAGKLDPAIDFTAQTSANNVTATLNVSGYADAPKIRLSSSPQLPQDEILGHLLFGQSVKQLSPFQLAAIAQAIGSLAGTGGGDALGAVRNSLGLDRLSVGAASSGGGATVEAGKYVAKGVFLGARQGTGGGTQAKVQIDLTRHLKLESRLGSGGAPVAGALTPENDPGSSIGLTYQFEY